MLCQQQPTQQTGDLPMTTTYESIDSSSTPDNVTYTRLQKPHDYENVENAR